MTRMLSLLLAFTIISLSMGGCSLFSGDEDTVGVQDIDSQSASSDLLLDTEDEMLEESDDLIADRNEESGDPGIDEFSEGGLEEFSEESLDEELGSASLDEDDSFYENDSDFDEQEFSATNEVEVDQQLANEELDEFAAMEAEEDEFALEAEPIIDEPSPEAPVVDIPESSPQPMLTNNRVTNLEYKAFEKGGTVVIETSGPANYNTVTNPDLNQVVIEVMGVELPDRFKLPYITKDFKQDIATINAYEQGDGSARFVIQMKRPLEPVVQQEGNSILVMTSDSGAMQASQGPVEQPLDQLVAENQMTITTPEGEPVQSLTTNQAAVAANKNPKLDISKTFGGADRSGLTLSQGQFVGEKINLEYIDTDVREIIENISERSGVNLIMDDDVSGKTSIRLRDIPWDQALVVLLRSKGLGYVKQGTVLRVARQDTLSKEAQAVSTQIQSEKQAQLLSGGIKVKYIPVSYADVKELSAKLTAFLSEKGKVASDDRTNSLVITDYGEYIERVTELVRALDTAPMQVEIEAKIVEARETFIQQAGINWGMTGQNFDLGPQQATIRSSLVANNFPDQGFTLDLSVGTFDILGDLTAALAVFESDNKIKILSQPRTVTMNKVESEITQTLQVPVRETIIVPGQPPQITFNFVDVKLGLKVTPQITFKGDVILNVDLSRDFVGDINEAGAREINKRQAKTTVMVKNGKTAVIGGIYQIDDGNLETGVPLLKDIPLLGYLFKQNRIEKIKNELLLFLKPKILREVDGPMVSKAQNPDPAYNPFEELSLDEGNEVFSEESGSDKIESFSEPGLEEELEEEML